MNYDKFVLSAFSLIAILVAADVIADLNQGVSFQHIGIEIGIFLVAAFGGASVTLNALRTLVNRESNLRKDMERVEREREHWRKQARAYLTGLGESIDAQFDRWQFTAAEKAVGLLVLKGLSHKEIANVRGTAEKTVRQQAAALYAKAGMEGKLQLLAFFLDDLMLSSDLVESAPGERVNSVG